MASKYKHKDASAVLTFNGQWVSWSHTVVAYAAFLSALVVGVALHYHQIVQNEWYGYPQEWFPSVSATIGDRYPERSFFMVFIAITSGPRFALVGLWYILTARPGHVLPKVVAVAGLVRTLTCGGWTYITSTDDHNWHDILMISYLVFTIPWTAGCLALSPPNPEAIKYRKYLAGGFFGTLVPLVYFFIQHKVHRVPGAYTTYAFFEWALILFDVAFDAVTALDFSTFEIVVRDVKGTSKGATKSFVPTAVLEHEKAKATGGLFSDGFDLTLALDVAADVYHGFVFWSVLTSLGLLIWFFPLWYMGLCGYEVFVLSTIGPLVLGIKPAASLFYGNQRTVHLIASVAGLTAFLVKDPAMRLVAVSLGVFMSCTAWAATFHINAKAANPSRLESRILALILGLILSSLAKFAWHTNNPVWPIMRAENGGWNWTGLVLAVPAALRFTRGPATMASDHGAHHRPGSPMLSALSIGGLFYGLHALLSDTSTMILWVWDGFPVRGPVSNVHGWYTIAAMSAGVLLGVYRTRLVLTWTAFGIACVGAALVTLYHHWLGYFGALALTVYLTGMATPVITNAAAKGHPVVTFGLGFMLYNLLVLAHVWVTAYAFVPGGPLLREHTDWVMTAMMLCLGAGLWDMISHGSSGAASLSLRNRKKATEKQQRHSGPAHRQIRYRVAALGLLNLFFLVASFRRFPTNDFQPNHGADRLITVGIWTIHFTLDNDMWSSEARMAALLREMEVDVVGLLESDTQHIIMGNRDSTQVLAEELGMYVDFGPGPDKHTWGCALLSKFPILKSTHHLLPSPVGELAPAIHATIDAYGTPVDVFVFHSGQEEDLEDRRLQSLYLRDLMGSTDRPAVLLSYLVTHPLEGTYNTFVSSESGMHDVDPSDWDRWCEYILYKGLQRTGYARVSRSTITDTELQVAKFRVPEPADEAERARLWAAPDEVRNTRVEEADVPEGWRFPALFRGEGVRGHRYHVFDEPWYYNY